MEQASDRVSIVVPAFNEEQNVPVLLERIAEMIEQSGLDCEAVLVDDGSTDGTYEAACSAQERYPFLTVVHHRRNRGKTAALVSGAEAATGDVLVLLDADLQFHPSEVPKLVTGIQSGADLVSGWKRGKYEKRLVSWIYNFLSRCLFHVTVHDLNAVKAFRREVLEAVELRKDWHRYLVVLAAEKGFKIAEEQVQLYPRLHGESKYGGVGRIAIGVFDLIAVKFQISFMRKPMLLFGGTGAFLIFCGTIVGLLALYLRFVMGQGFRPLLNLVMLLVSSGLLLFALGFLAEAIANVQERVERVEREVRRRRPPQA
jgi:glycosyltransferase involved in cell wall biosynthesis